MRLLVALAVMTHALWGCCMHHAHGASVARRGACEHGGAAACAGRGDHDPDRHGDCGSDPCHSGHATGVLARHAAHQGPPGAPAHEGCSEVKCLWLAAGEGSGVGDLRTSSAALQLTPPSLVLSDGAGAHGVWQATRQVGRTPPVRAHLMNCVLII